MCPIIIRPFGDDDSGAGLVGEFDNGVGVRDGGLLTVFDFNQDVSDLGVVHHDVDFPIFFAASVVAHTGGLLVVEGRHVLIDGGFHHLTQLNGICQHLIVHEDGVADCGVGDIDFRLLLQHFAPAHLHGPALVNQIGALQVVDIVLHRGPGDTVKLLGDGGDGDDVGGHVAQVQEDALQLRGAANIVEGGQVPFEHLVHHVLPHDLLGHQVIGGEGQFGESPHLQIAGEVVLHGGKFEHDRGALLLGHMCESRGADVRPQVGDFHADEGTVFKKGEGGHLDNAPPPGAALGAALDEGGAGGAGGYHLGPGLGVVDGLHPLIPITGVLDLVKKVVSVLLRPDVFMVALQDFIEPAELQHGVIHGDKDDALGLDAPLQERVDHLVLDGGFAHSPGAGEDHGAAQVCLIQPLDSLIIGKPAVLLGKIGVDAAGGPPGVEGPEDF